MTNPPPTPIDAPALLRAALIHHAEHRPREAQALYRRILTADPDHAQALAMLGLILADGPDAAEAEAVLLRCLALRPEHASSLHSLGRLQAGAGDDDAAAALFARAAVSAPHLAPIHNDMGAALHRLGRREEALAAFDRAIGLDPAYATAHANRGLALYESRRFDEAVQAQLAALAFADGPSRTAILVQLAQSARKAGRLAEAQAVLCAELDAGHDDSEIGAQLALVLEQARRPGEALTLRNDLARRAGLHRAGKTTAPPATVLALGAVGGGHTPTRYLLDPEVFSILTVTLLSPDQADAPLGGIDIEALKQADLVFSTLGDIDHDGGQFEATAALCRRLGRPVLNPPAAIARTGREQAAALFDGIADMVTPPVRRATPQTLAVLPILAPLLVRPRGDHGGENLILLRDEADKTAYLATDPADQLLLTPFHDFSSPDGHWRKYRLIFVDRQVFPFHLAIGDHWLTHYWRAEMGQAPWKMAEEEHFLADWRGVFGERAARAAEETARRLDLDYGGMDCALTADGRLLLFEANACMLLHLDEPAAAFGYKHRYTPPIREAFTRLTLARAGRGP